MKTMEQKPTESVQRGGEEREGEGRICSRRGNKERKLWRER